MAGFDVGSPLRSAVKLPDQAGRERLPSGADQVSHMSSDIRHSCAYFLTSSACSIGVGPGERLNTIGRPDLPIAALTM